MCVRLFSERAVVLVGWIPRASERAGGLRVRLCCAREEGLHGLSIFFARIFFVGPLALPALSLLYWMGEGGVYTA